ncbi:unnamed protein product [Mytilus edulis]|uniref:SAP domain-containing protein n=1 Tax=Mytilus edulis TaxID=6550 RepID=A0A8S3U9S0_MYTED|nr:unnamed protein product [Mytilus edulis]
MSENDTSIDTFKRWTVPVLQKYLRIRGLRTSWKKEELVALVYSADLMKIKPVLTPAEERKLKADQYCDKLKAPKANTGNTTIFRKLSDALLPACQNAAVFQYLHHNYTNYEPSEDFNVLSTEIVTTTEGTILPLSLPEIAGNCHDHNELLEN